MTIRIAGVIHGTTDSNGPGIRTGIWVQGCDFACPGCCNPHTWDSYGGEERDVEELALEVVRDAKPGTEGITLSGGEPLQSGGILTLIRSIKEKRPDWSVFMFTGYDISWPDHATKWRDERRLEDPEFKLSNGSWQNAVVNEVDILVTGKFVKELRCHALWRSSSNQKILFLTDRYAHMEEKVKASSAILAEIFIEEDGSYTTTGLAGRMKL